MTRRHPNEPRRADFDRKCDPRPARTAPGMSEDARRLAGESTGLAIALAAPFVAAAPGAEDDLQSVALVALCESADSFVRERGVAFSAYARHRILGALRTEALKGARAGLVGDGEAPAVLPMVRPDSAVGKGAGPGDDPGDGPDAPAAAAGGGEDDDAFERMIVPLRPTQRDVLRAIYRDGMSYQAAAERLGCSVDSIDHLRRQAIERLRAVPA